jgi:acyl-CoA synthetase (AMP-forming)/AMP-acid ligase II
MNLSMLLEMAAQGAPDRIGLGSRHGGLTYAQLLERTRSTAAWLDDRDLPSVGIVDQNSEAVPLLLFGAALSGRVFAPLNYRLAPEQLSSILERLAPALIVKGDEVALPEGAPDGLEVIDRSAYLAATADPVGEEAFWSPDPDDIAVLLFTSGTTGAPKGAVLRHRHLVTYIISTVEFLGSPEEDAALISVPPYHVAGISAVLSSVYSGRRMVQMEAFEPAAWTALAREEQITHAMVVPTMLGRILDVIEREGTGLPHLRHLSYGGGRMPVSTIERALELLPGVDFVNAYGLTETSSTIAVLGPDDHRAALASADPEARRRLGSVGRPLPTLELEIRDHDGKALPPGQVGEIHVRGEQVSGEYLSGAVTDEQGWFATKDGGFVDAEGFLFVEGRLDDVIVRGGENMSPGEIEETLLAHASVAEVGVFGVPDTEWGEKVVAAVVLSDGAGASEADLQEWVRSHLRSSRTPARVVFVDELPYNETGKLLRRVLRSTYAD